MVGAAGGGGGGAGCSGGGGGGGGGTFFLQLAANTASVTAIAMTVKFLVLNMNCPPQLSKSYLPQTGVQLLPCVVSCLTCVPSASIDQICGGPLRVDINTRCFPSGAQLGFSFRPSPCVSCV